MAAIPATGSWLLPHLRPSEAGPAKIATGDQRIAATETLGPSAARLVHLSTVCLVDPTPRQVLPPPRQLIGTPRELLLRLELLYPRCEPPFTCTDPVLRHL